MKFHKIKSSIVCTQCHARISEKKFITLHGVEQSQFDFCRKLLLKCGQNVLNKAEELDWKHPDINTDLCSSCWSKKNVNGV